MAKTLKARFTARLEDHNGNAAAATAYVFLDPAATGTQILAELTSWLTALEGVTSADIVGADISLTSTASPVGDTNTNFSDSNVIETGVLDFKVPATGNVWGFAIPSLSDTMVVGGKFNVADGAVTTLVGAMGSTTYAQYRTNGSDNLGDLKRGFRTGRKHRGIRSKSSQSA